MPNRHLKYGGARLSGGDWVSVSTQAKVKHGSFQMNLITHCKADGKQRPRLMQSRPKPVALHEGTSLVSIHYRFRCNVSVHHGLRTGLCSQDLAEDLGESLAVRAALSGPLSATTGEGGG